jgi:subtilisin family serine protease
MTRLGIAAIVALAVAVLASGAAARNTHASASALAPALAQRLAQAGPNEQIDVVVVLRRQASLPAAHGRRAARLARVERALRGTATDEQRPLLALLARRHGEGHVGKVVPLWIFNGIVTSATPAVVRELAQRPDVLEVRASRTLDARTSLASGPPEPNVAAVGAPALWDLGVRGQGVVVANMDTGVDVTHPDLAGSWRGGANSWYDPNGQHPSTPTDVYGHGTWTMGVMVGGDAGGTAVGVAPGATWIAAKIFDDRGIATTARIHQSFQWLLDPDRNPATDDAPDVVNNSWSMGAPGCDLEFQLDLRNLRAAGILPVFAAGNGGPGAATSFSPANNPDALAVGGSDNDDGLDPGSSRGPSACDGSLFPDVVAPDQGITTTDLYGFYTTASGTSLAAAHASGALALLLSAFPDTSVERQEAALESAAHDLAATGPDNDTGYGRIDAAAAYDWLATIPDFQLGAAEPSASTRSGGTVSYTLAVDSTNGFDGDVALSLGGLSGGQASWTFTPSTVGGGSGTARLDVATSASIAPGTYPLTVTGASASTTHTLALTLEVTAPPDFAMSASPSSATSVAGGSVSYKVAVASLYGFGGSVGLTLGGLSPAQASWSFSPATIVASGTATLTVATAASLAPGTYPLSITGTSGSTTHTAPASLVVAVKPDFALGVDPATSSVTAGGSTTYTIAVMRQGGFTGSVSLSVTGLPYAATGSFSPASVTGGSSRLTVRTQSFTTRGTFTLKITGKSGTLSRQTTATLVVR